MTGGVVPTILILTRNTFMFLSLWRVAFSCSNCGKQLPEKNKIMLARCDEQFKATCVLDCGGCDFNDWVVVDGKPIKDNNIQVYKVSRNSLSVKIIGDSKINLDHLRSILKSISDDGGYSIIYVNMSSLNTCHFIQMCKETRVTQDVYISNGCGGYELIPYYYLG